MLAMRQLLILPLLVISVISADAQSVGTCEPGEAEADLDVNNVRARAYNNGGLFWRGSGNTYVVPKDGEAQSIYAASIWIGGLDDQSVFRFAGTARGPFEYWPGPLDESGNPPADCSQYDHIFNVYKSEIEAVDRGEPATDDIINWPHDLGAPVKDGDGITGNYNIAGGDRPDITGDQMLWWIMNDVGNEKRWSTKLPMGLEVQVSAFAFDDSTAMNNTTFYRYHLINRGSVALSDTYFTYWYDPDLGNASDDFVGSDSTAGLGIVYNGTEKDIGRNGDYRPIYYGDRPPALGIDFLQGPLVSDPNNGIWTDPNGTVYPGMYRLPMTVFTYYNSDSSVQGNPSGRSPTDTRYYMSGRWRDGTRMTFGGTGYGGSRPTKFMFSGNAAKHEYWSEENTDGLGSRNTPADRRSLMSTGPFDFLPGDEQEIVFAIVWSQGSSRFASYAKLLQDDIYIQGLFDRNFVEMPAIDAPLVSASTTDQRIILEWENPPSSNNYLDSYDERSGFVYNKLGPNLDLSYSFEGYNIIQYESETDSIGKIIATYDKVNGIRGVAEERFDDRNHLYVTEVTANGDDNGVQHYHIITDALNYNDYYLGVQAYAYNENSRPKIVAGPVSRIHVVPTPTNSFVTDRAAVQGDRIFSSRTSGGGNESGIFATVVNADVIPSTQYRIAVDTVSDGSATTYSITDLTSNNVLLDGFSLYQSQKTIPPFAPDVVYSDGLTFSVTSEEIDFAGFLTTANANGAIDPPTGAAADFNGFPVPGRAGSNQQVGNGIWFIQSVDSAGEPSTVGSYESFLLHVSDDSLRSLAPDDFEIRFTNTGSTGYNLATDELVGLPFSIWNTGPGTPDDASDDYQMIVGLIDNSSNGFSLRWKDHTSSGNDNDPYTDQFTWFNPLDQRPGNIGYEEWLNAVQNGGPVDNHGLAVLTNLVFMNWNGGAISAATDETDFLNNIVNQVLPEPGTIFRIETTKPLAAGDVFIIDTADYAATIDPTAGAIATLDQIGIVPNPYLGSSAFETGTTPHRVRFTSMPQDATIRVFTIAGTLVTELQKSDSLPYFEWDLRNDSGRLIGSGVFLIHISIPNAGERVLKFGHIRRSEN